MLRKKLKLTSREDASQKEETTALHQFVDNTSRYFFANSEIDIPTQYLQYEKDLNSKLSNLTFKHPVEYVYNPLEYAFEPHANFVTTYCKTEKKILFLGLNPGPWGMCQTGVPFGEVKIVKEWLQISGNVSKPQVECPKKEIKGFECHRSEESGKRFYGFFKQLCGTPEIFFKYSFVHNLCPLAMMAQGSANITPAEIKGEAKKHLDIFCRETLSLILYLLQVKIIIALGRHSQTQAQNIVQHYKLNNVDVIYMPHPSPRVVGNENWAEKAKKVLVDYDLLKYFKS